MIRKATRKDYPVLAELAHQLFLEENKTHGGSFDISKDFIKLEIREFEKQIGKRKAVLFLAEEDGEAVGFIFGQIQKLDNIIFKDKYRGHVGIIYVKPGYRNRGIGTKLFKVLKAWFNKKKIKFLDISMMSKNPRAKRLYRKLGFKPTIELWWHK